MNGIELKNITKYYGEKCVLNNINLSLEENHIYGLLGRNGAGKSTLLNILTNRIFANTGEVTIDGVSARDNDSALCKLFLVNESDYFPEKMKVKTAFHWAKKFFPSFDAAYAKQLANTFKLNMNAVVKSLSTGYNSIFKLILALSVNTPYIILDEPVLGLDANHRELFYQILLKKFSDNPCTIVISTHLIEEISTLIDHIIIIDQGQILKNDSCESLLSLGKSHPVLKFPNWIFKSYLLSLLTTRR
ncbi:MAG: putative transport system ATP-binding protein [Herbinix sp.]|nr:putative transport system ATP-binding protein [Herbinix sp.]